MGKTDLKDLMLSRWFEKTVKKCCVKKIIKLYWIQWKQGLAWS